MKTLSKIVSALGVAALLSVTVTAHAVDSNKPPVKLTVKSAAGGKNCYRGDAVAKSGETKVIETGPGTAAPMTCLDGTWNPPLQPLSKDASK